MISMRLIHRILCGLALLSCIKDAQSAVLECPAPGGAPLVVDGKFEFSSLTLITGFHEFSINLID